MEFAQKLGEYYRFKEGDKVTFDVHTLKGKGRICGCALVLPYLYIIEVMESDPKLPSEEYPFSCISLPESFLAIDK